MSASIYLLTNTITGDRYVGQTLRPTHVRWRAHVHSALRCGSETHLHRAIRKYSESSFTLTILEHTTPNLLNKREQYWINVLHPEYNMTMGGEGGSPTEEVREKLRRAALSNWQKPEHRARMKKTHVGFTGRTHTKSANSKRSQRLMGRPKNDEHRQRLREASLRLWSDPDYRAKMIEVRRRRSQHQPRL